MSCRYSPRDLQLINDLKKRKKGKRIDDSDQISLSFGECSSATFNSQIKMVEDSQSKGQRDLFGELLPDKPYSPVPSNKSVKKKTMSKKKENRYEELLRERSPVRTRPTITITPRTIEIMKEVQTELYTLMGLNKSSSDVLVTPNKSLNVSGIQSLLDSPIPKANNECKTKTNSIRRYEMNEKSDPIFTGVNVFIDYKMDDPQNVDITIAHFLTKMGGKAEKTFNLKVSHVIFCDGSQKTFDKARERNIPLVRAMWIFESNKANKVLDPADYPAQISEKYTRPKKIKNKINEIIKSHKKLEIKKKKELIREKLFESKLDNLTEHINNFMKSLETQKENTNNGTSIETPKKQTTIQKPDDQTNDINILPDQICEVLNTDDSQILNEDIDEMYVPESVKTLRMMLTPKKKQNQTPAELNSILTKIEDRLNLNSQKRQQLRKILFPSNEELLNMSVHSDFPSPQKKIETVLELNYIMLQKNGQESSRKN